MSDWRKKVLRLVLALAFAPALMAFHCPIESIDCLLHERETNGCVDEVPELD